MGRGADGFTLSAVIRPTYTLPQATTTNNFADLGDPIDLRSAESGSQVLIILTNSGGTNGASYQVLGTINGTDVVTVVASANLALSTSVAVPVTGAYPTLRVQVKAQVGGSQTTIKGAAFCR